MNTTIPGLDNSNNNENILDESSNKNYTKNGNPILALPLYLQEAEEEARELVKVIRRMHTADKRYWEESEFLLLRNEVALHTLFQDNKSTISPRKSVDLFPAERDAERWEAESPCFQESKADEEQRRSAIIDSEVDHKATVGKWRGVIDGLREQNQTTPQSLDIQVIEDRIDKARLDLNFLEQQTMQMEREMKTLQMELAKLKDQLCQTQI